MKKGVIVCIIIACITIILILVLILSFNYSKYKMETTEKTKQIKIEQKAEQKRQDNLENCIIQAKSNRTNLWNSNCTKQSDGNCTIKSNSGVSEWIEQRYQQDLENCYKLYEK